jgi:peptide/nickel transport system ATP-binding protein
MAVAPATPLFEVDDLHVTFDTPDGLVQAVRGVSFAVQPGEVLGVVGESGSGKSVTMLAAMGLLPSTASVYGAARFEGQDLIGLDQEELRRYRGRRIAMIFQDPLTSLNPVLTLGQQIGGALAAHGGRAASRSRDLRRRAIDLLELVSIPNPGRRVDSYPHELSGGMRQRAMIALSMANEPELLIADEPTTALDVTIQAQILEVLRTIQRERGLGIVLITHDLGVIAGMADRVTVMYAGRVVEEGSVGHLFAGSRHPYTRGLIACLPRLDRRDVEIIPIEGSPPSATDLPTGCAFHPRCRYAVDICSVVDPVLRPAGAVSSACHRSEELEPFDAELAAVARTLRAPVGERDPILRVDNLEKRYNVRSRGLFRRVTDQVHAVSGVSFQLRPGEILSLVGESGCGKSTTGRCVLRLVEPDGGSVEFRGEDVLTKAPRDMRSLRANLQIVFQDPYSSLNPRMRVGEIVAEPLVVHGMGAREAAGRARELLELVHLRPEHADRYPHEFSGGQRQRVSLARALALEPDVLVLDEPVSSLDVSIQAGIIQLLDELRDRLGLAYLFIAHDLSVVRHISDNVAVMYLGKVVEVGSTDDVFDRPCHPYTQALLSAIPIPDPTVERTRTRIILEGDVPSGIDPPSGCPFRTRCWKAEAICTVDEPQLLDPGAGHLVACHFPDVTAPAFEASPRPPSTDRPPGPGQAMLRDEAVAMRGADAIGDVPPDVAPRSSS